MAYIGNSPANVGNYQEVDDISSSFNGSTTSFNLLVDSAAITPAKSGQLLVSVNGVMQEPDDTGTNGFKVSGSTIVFSAAPATSSTFWAMYQGQNVDVGTPSSGTVGTAQMSSAELELSGGLGLGDNVKAQFGAGNDLQIYHSGSTSYIQDAGTGDLKILSSNDLWIEGINGEPQARFAENGACTFYYDNSTKLATTSTGIDVTGRITTDGITEDASGNVGIGESSPDTILHVKETIDVAYSAGNITTDANNLLKLENPSTTATAFAGMQFRTGSGCDMYFGSVQGAGNAGSFVFANQNSTDVEMMRIDSSGNVGIGVTPESWRSTRSVLQLGTTASVVGDQWDNAWFNANSWEDSSGTFKYITSDFAASHELTNGTHIFKVAPSGTADAAISWTTAMTIDNDGVVSTVGDFQPGADIQLANGRGISFSNMPNASGMTSELLDDYEEGTWTPEFRGSTGSAGTSATTVYGATYTKIGNVVNIECYLRWGDQGSWTGNLHLYGLPYAHEASTRSVGVSSGLKKVEMPDSLPFVPIMIAGNSYLHFNRLISDNPAKSYAQASWFNDNLNEFVVSISYRV